MRDYYTHNTSDACFFKHSDWKQTGTHKDHTEYRVGQHNLIFVRYKAYVMNHNNFIYLLLTAG